MYCDTSIHWPYSVLKRNEILIHMIAWFSRALGWVKKKVHLKKLHTVQFYFNILKMTQLQRCRTNYPLPINRDAEGRKRGDLELHGSFLAVMEQYCTLIKVVVKSRHEMLSKCTEVYTHTHEWVHWKPWNLNTTT